MTQCKISLNPVLRQTRTLAVEGEGCARKVASNPSILRSVSMSITLSHGCAVAVVSHCYMAAEVLSPFGGRSVTLYATEVCDAAVRWKCVTPLCGGSVSCHCVTEVLCRCTAEVSRHFAAAVVSHGCAVEVMVRGSVMVMPLSGRGPLWKL